MGTSERLAIGTVQFGLPYGIANTSGQVTIENAKCILDEAWEQGVNMLDTAIAYGESETILGKIGVKHWRVISKIPPLPADTTSIETTLQAMLEGSLSRLNLTSLSGVLIHDTDQLLNNSGDRIYTALSKLKEQGLIDKLGISIYEPDELDLLINRYPVDIVQAPLNVFDRRLIQSGWLSRLKSNDVEVHARSVFLQGLLLMRPNDIPVKFKSWYRHFEHWQDWLDKERINAIQGCLGFALSQENVDKIVIGVDSLQQLNEIFQNLDSRATPPDNLVCNDLDLINPSCW